jgi:hypothetical protein
MTIDHWMKHKLQANDLCWISAADLGSQVFRAVFPGRDNEPAPVVEGRNVFRNPLEFSQKPEKTALSHFPS